MWNKLRNEPVNKTGYIKRIIAYGIDWYLGSVLSSLPLILLYMSLHKDAVYIPQQLSIFKGYYQVLAGVLSLSVALVYYVVFGTTSRKSTSQTEISLLIQLLFT